MDQKAEYLQQQKKSLADYYYLAGSALSSQHSARETKFINIFISNLRDLEVL
jgi:hypothetical protein